MTFAIFKTQSARIIKRKCFPEIFIRIIVFLILIGSLTSAPCQNFTIQARILDKKTHAPISFSTIVFSETEGTISDDNGYFQYKLPPSRHFDSLRVSCIGYISRSFFIDDLNKGKLDTLFLDQATSKIDEVEIVGKRKRERTSEKIIIDAILKLKNNYQDVPTLITGYYREYLKHNDEYVNLIESLIQLEDPGFLEKDDFKVYLNYKRLNHDFKIDSSLLEVYNKFTKFVPFGIIPDVSQNNLHILRFADPIRNYNRSSVSHFKVFEDDFVQNHNFNEPEFTYMDGESFYKIDFTDNQYYTYGNITVRMLGTIYINVKDEAINKITYKALLDQGLSKTKLFEINLEYKKTDEKYNLHYISHNNLLKHKNFYLQKTDLKKGKLLIELSRKVNPDIALNPENYYIKAKGFEQAVENIQLDNDSILITFSNRSLIGKNILEDYPFFRIIKRRKVKKQIREIKQDLTLELKNFVDTLGVPLSDKEYEEYYQYREFFVKERTKDTNLSDKQEMDLSIPLIYNPVLKNMNPDTMWMNTPLVSEKLSENKAFSSIPIQNTYINYSYRKLLNGTNDIAYIHTDRELYAPEDTLWFKAYIRNKIFLTPSNSCKTFFVKLVNTSGEVVNSGKYFNVDGEILGEFKLDYKLQQGIYTLIGYSSWMKNFEVEEIFRKRVMIKKELREGMKIFLECDKAEYQAGDTVSMKIHVKDEYNREIEGINLNYKISSNGELLAKGKENTTIATSNPLTFILPSELSDAPVININGKHRSYDLDTTYNLPVKTSVQVSFYPEGGNLVNGINSKVAVQSLANNGEPLAIEGSVINQKGKEICKVKTNSFGFGTFNFRPETNSTYTLRINSPYLQSDSITLPWSLSKGWTLGLNQDKKNLIVELQHNFEEFRTGLLTVSVRGDLCYYSAVDVLAKQRVLIPLDEIPAGVAVITLFDQRMLPRAERLAFIPPKTIYTADVSTLRKTYLPRDSIFVMIKIKSDAAIHNGSYSLAVVDDFMGSTRDLDEPNILSSLLLSPEIKGDIKNINQYLNPDNPDAEENLEHLLMTQGWRNYSLDYKAISKPENRDIIYGTLKKALFARDLEPVEGSVVVYFSGTTSTIKTNENGFFSFYPVVTKKHNTDIFMNASDKRGSRNVSIILDSTAFERNLENYLKAISGKTVLKPNPKPETYYSFSDNFSYGIENHKWLEEVVVSKTVERIDMAITDFAFDKKTATKEELEMAIDLEHLSEMVHILNPNNYVLWYSVDGWIQSKLIEQDEGRSPPKEVPDSSLINNLNPKDIKSYTVVMGPEAEALYGIGKFYVIDIVTKTREERAVNSRTINPLIIEKYAVSKQFYSPSYRTKIMRDNPFPDLRKTIYWNPRVPVDENGYAKVFFYNGDRYTRIRCTFEGITTNGIPIHAEHTYNIGMTRE